MQKYAKNLRNAFTTTSSINNGGASTVEKKSKFHEKL
jgi:hypothetical protein